jgi:hypothetical protein
MGCLNPALTGARELFSNAVLSDHLPIVAQWLLQFYDRLAFEKRRFLVTRTALLIGEFCFQSCFGFGANVIRQRLPVKKIFIENNARSRSVRF